jgi:hypothetical protein
MYEIVNKGLNNLNGVRSGNSGIARHNIYATQYKFVKIH